MFCFLWLDWIHVIPKILECVASNLSTLLVFIESFRFVICLSYFCLCVLQAATKILARQLVRLRQQIANLQGSRAQMRGIATHTQVDCQRSVFFFFFFLVQCAWCSSNILSCMQAMHAQSSVAVGMKGATKAMAAMNKVWW